MLHDGRAADTLVGRLGVGAKALDGLIARGRIPAPTQRYRHGGLGTRGTVLVNAAVGGAIGLSSQDVAGVRVDASTGRRTLYVQRTVEGSLSLISAVVGRDGCAQGSASAMP